MEKNRWRVTKQNGREWNRIEPKLMERNRTQWNGRMEWGKTEQNGIKQNTIKRNRTQWNRMKEEEQNGTEWNTLKLRGTERNEIEWR